MFSQFPLLIFPKSYWFSRVCKNIENIGRFHSMDGQRKEGDFGSSQSSVGFQFFNFFPIESSEIEAPVNFLPEMIESSEIEAPLNFLPDMIDEIMTWVPAKAVMRFRCLSKYFLQFLKYDPNFLNKHLSRINHNANNHSFILHVKDSNFFYYIPDGGSFDKTVKLETDIPEYAKIVGSSNGLVCLSSSNTPYISNLSVITTSLWNPVTGEYKITPEPQIKGNMGILGFGFHPIVNDYKIVRITCAHHQNGKRMFRLEAEVYSLSRDCWKSVGFHPYLCLDEPSIGIFNGIVHLGACYGTSLKKYEVILSFDLGDDVFGVVPIPEVVNSTFSAHLFLRAFNGCLAMFVMNLHMDVDIWVMKQYGREESWTKLYRMDNLAVTYYPLDFSQDGEVLLRGSVGRLVSYSSESKEIKDLQIPGVNTESSFEIVPYVESIVDRLSELKKAVEGQENKNDGESADA